MVRDLRIGNLVKIEGFSDVMEVHSIGRDEVVLTTFPDNHEYSADYEELVALPLTKEWLIKSGFSDEVWQKLVLPDPLTGAINSLVFNSGFLGFNQEARQGWTNTQLLEAMNDLKNHPKFDLDNISFPPLKNTNVLLTNHIKYVHQLQNLYLALTGEELQIKA